ncbi:restriction endonuclease [Pseudomonas sp. GXM4]|uniref:restriction endonuclease n=1 Tax=Pseudomonas sp. GXM4 TaxID=2651867 RepID=UPI00124E43D6|nr:restriction endonuclease [Pseudomonas sp. GXM4]KAB2518459.1 restriction endonuclease [Pseudomonas sp. GXM4]
MNNYRKSMPCDWTDEDVENEITLIRNSIKAWAEKLDIWFDCGFKSHLDHFQCEPSEEPIVTMFYVDGGIDSITCSELDTEFSALLEGLGYWYEQEDSIMVGIYATDEGRSEKFREYFHWQWVCSLLVEDTGDVYEELFSHFSKRPEDLHKLHWREFEILLFRIFQNHGYKAFLGPGSSDEGVDLRLWQRNPIGDVLTVVQAKTYAPKNKIDLVPVQALYGASKAEGAHQSLFVTTSSYRPAAHKFAARVSGELRLAQKDDIVSWCEKATDGVIVDKSTLVEREKVERLLALLAHYPDARIVHATWGYNMIHNSYAVVIKETRHAALLLTIGNREISNDGYGTRGTEVPRLDISTMTFFNEEGVVRAKRSVDESGRVSYWDGDHYYTPWGKRPNSFDYMD